MTAPSRIWIDAWGGNWSQLSGGTQNVEYIRADAPELLALVGVLRRVMADPNWRTNDNTLWPDMTAALAAWEAIAPKPATDALTPWGIQPDGSGLDPATLPIHLGRKARDDA